MESGLPIKKKQSKEEVNEGTRADYQAVASKIVERCKEKLWHFIYKYVENVADAEDILQTTTCNFIAHPVDTNELGLQKCLFKTARNAINTHFRKKKREDRAQKVVGSFSPKSEDNPAEQVVNDEILTLLIQEIHDLPKKQRDALILCYFSNMTHKKIGSLLGVSENAACKLVNRAVDSLRQSHSRKGVI